MRRLVVFDDGKGQLAPLTDLRPAFDLRTGALTTLERWVNSLEAPPAAGLYVPESIHDLAQEQHAEPLGEHGSGPILIINGRCPIPPERVKDLGSGEALIEAESGELIAAAVEPDAAPDIITGNLSNLKTTPLDGKWLLTRPWDVRAFRDRAMAIDLHLLAGQNSHALPDGVIHFGINPLTVHSDADILPGAILDTSHGAIVIAADATIRPGAIIAGPAYIGPHSTILDNAIIKANTAIGPWCKIGGEVGGTIFQGYSNKAHDGHLGDSWIGQWVNLGAGTTNSNLLNTYGQIVAQPTPGGSYERTGQTFLGTIIGDHVKTAIGTRIMTGAIIGTGTMWAGVEAITGHVNRFSWVTDEGTRPYRFEKFIRVEKTMMARRSIEPSEAYIDALNTLQAQTRQ